MWTPGILDKINFHGPILCISNLDVCCLEHTTYAPHIHKMNSSSGGSGSGCGGSFSGGGSGSNDPVEVVRPKVVTVKHPESNKPKPTAKKGKALQADVDVTKELQRCRDENIKRLDLSKSSITIIPQSVKECTHLVEFYLYGNKIASLPPEIGCVCELKISRLRGGIYTCIRIAAVDAGYI